MNRTIGKSGKKLVEFLDSKRIKNKDAINKREITKKI